MASLQILSSEKQMGCLLCYEEYRSVGTQTSRITDPEGCILSREITFETLIVVAPEEICVNNKDDPSAKG